MSVLSKIRTLHTGTLCQNRYATMLLPLFLLALLLGGPRTVQAADVSGTITLEDCASFPQSVHLKFWPTAGGTTVTQTVNLASNGTFSVTGLANTTYILTIKGAKWLRKNTNVNTTGGNVSGLSITLLAGDGNNDNGVDVLDLDNLIASFDLCDIDTGFDTQADFNCDGCADILDLDIVIGNFDLVGDEDPVPALVNFNITQTEVYGGSEIEITFNLADPPPSGGATVNLTCAPAASVQTTNVNVTSTSTVTLNFKTSTTNHTTDATVFASYDGTTVKDTVRLKPVHLRVTGIQPGRVRLEWSSYTSPYGFIIKRTPGQTNGVTTTTTTTHHDDFTFTLDSQDYVYELYTKTMQGAAGDLLATEKVKFSKVVAEANQTVDSRIDRRYAVDTLVDFPFGTRTYRGGLFAGKAEDESRVGRSFARFPFSSNPLTTTTTLRCGIANAYFMGLHRKNKSSGSYSPVDIYCQSLHTSGVDTLDMSALVWSTSPAVTLPATGFSKATVAMSGSGYVLPGEWALWDVSQGVLDSLRGDLKLTVAWTGQSDTTNGWAYFARKEYDADLGPALYYAITYPTPVAISFRDSNNQAVSTVVSGTPVTVHVDMNGLGVGDEIVVTVVYKQGIEILMLSPTAPEISGLDPTFTFNAQADLDGLMSGQGTSISVEVTCNGVTKSKNLIVTKS